MTTATPDDVAVTLGRTTPDINSVEYSQWQRWINNATLLLRVGDGDHQGFGNLDLLDQDVLEYVIVESVAAMVRRPDDAMQVDVAVDDGRVSRVYAPGSQRVFIRDDFWQMLANSDGDSFSIGPC